MYSKTTKLKSVPSGGTFIETLVGATAVFWVLVMLIVGPLAFQYLLWQVFHKDIPWGLDFLAGILIFDEFPKSLAFLVVTCEVLLACGLTNPLWFSVKAALGY